MNSKMILSAAAAALFFSSCRKTDNATPDTRAVLGYQMKVTEASATTTVKASSEGTIQWTAGYAYPREMRLAANANNGKAEYRSMDTSRINLFDGAREVFGHVAVEQGSYKEVEMAIKLSPTSIYPAAQLKGIYTNSTGTSLPITLQMFDACELKMQVQDLTIDNSSNFAAVASLDLSIVSQGITESMINDAEITDGTLLISDRVNTHLYYAILNNLKSKTHSVQIGKR